MYFFFSGEFVLLDSKTFKVKGKWNVEGSKTDFNYDYWYQPRKNVMLSTEWGSPSKIKTGFNPAHVGDGKFFKWFLDNREICVSILYESRIFRSS
jgi:hypothetical protein